MMDLDEGAIERVAIEYHDADGDDYTVSWRKAKSSYRGTVRKMVRTMFASAARAGLTIVSAKDVAAKDAEIAKLREVLKDARRSVRNARGAVESNQVVDKDVHGTLTGVIARIDAALAGGPDG